MIRDWLMAVKRGDYGQAADFFAPGAIIDQGRPFRLPDAAAARIFNAGLPCGADLVELEDEGTQVLATFRLGARPGGPCRGRVQVRYTIEDGKFTEWRQLGDRAGRPARGDPARAPRRRLDPLALGQPVVAPQLRLARAPLLVGRLGRDGGTAVGWPSSSSATIVR